LFEIILKKFNETDNKLLGIFVFLISLACHFGFIKNNYGSDEGLFLLQARMLTDGIYPVRDYFSKDAPYFLIIYGYLMKVFGFNIFISRTISYVISSTIGVCIYIYVLKIYKRKDIALLSVSIFLTSLLYMLEGSPHISSVNHSITSVFFLMLALILASSNLVRVRYVYILMLSFIIGLFISIGIWCRTPHVFPAFIILMFYIYNIKKLSDPFVVKLKIYLFIIIGLIFGSSFMFYLFIEAPENFVFSYIGISSFFEGYDLYTQPVSYHESPWSYRLYVFKEFIQSFYGQNATLILLYIASICLVLSIKAFKNYKIIILQIMIIVLSQIFVYAFLSVYGFTWHYFASFIPFYVLGMAPVLIYCVDACLKLKYKNIFALFFLLLIIYHIQLGIRTIRGSYINLINNSERIGLQAQLSVSKVSEYIINNTKDYELVLSGTQAPLFVSGRYPPGILVNTSWFSQLFPVIKENDYKKFHLISKNYLVQMINNKDFRLIVDDPNFTSRLGYEIEEAIKNNYTLIKVVDYDYKIYAPTLDS